MISQFLSFTYKRTHSLIHSTFSSATKKVKNFVFLMWKVGLTLSVEENGTLLKWNLILNYIFFFFAIFNDSSIHSLKRVLNSSYCSFPPLLRTVMNHDIFRFSSPSLASNIEWSVKFYYFSIELYLMKRARASQWHIWLEIPCRGNKKGTLEWKNLIFLLVIFSCFTFVEQKMRFIIEYSGY